jgi:hypothetical protein
MEGRIGGIAGMGWNNSDAAYASNQAIGLQNATRTVPTLGENIERRLQHCREEIASAQKEIARLEATRAKFDKANMLDMKADEIANLLRY